MTAATAAPTLDVERPHRSAFGWAVADTKVIAWRNLVTLRRLPQLLVFATVQPVIFVLMFRYVFGGAIHIPGPFPYVDYLMPGVFAQTVAFGAIQTGQLNGPYSTLIMLTVRAVPMIVELDWPDEIWLHADSSANDQAVSILAGEVLEALKRHRPS
jgi:ABC-2 type transport system permease protein/oleandomycin transport system permease protein